MKKSYFILLFVVIISLLCPSFAQVNKIDSLNLALKQVKTDSSKINILNLLAKEFSLTKADTAIAISTQALQLAQKTNWKKGIASSENYLGNFYFIKQQYDNSMLHYNKALSLWIELIRSSDKELSVSGKKGQIVTIDDIGNVYNDQGKFAKALEFWEKALKLAEEINYKDEIIRLFSNIGSSYRVHGESKKALEYFNKILKQFDKPEDKSVRTNAFKLIGMAYKDMGEYSKAIENLLMALTQAEELNDKKAIAMIRGNIGAVYGDQGDFKKSLEYFLKALKMAEVLHLEKLQISNLLNIGLLNTQLGKYDEGLDYFQKALVLIQKLNLKEQEAFAYDYIGFSFTKQGNYIKALYFTEKALIINKELDKKMGIIDNSRNIGTIYMKMGKYDKAEKLLNEALDISIKAEALGLIQSCEEVLTELYEKTGKPALAFEHYKKFISVRDSLQNEEAQKDQVRTEMNYEFDKKELANKAEQEKKDAVAKEEKQKQQFILFFVVIGLAVVLFFSFFLYRRFKLTEKQKEIIEKQKHLVEEKQKEIVDSITYAKRLQEAILPPIELIKKNLPNSFVMYKPKAIVAGDFYWMEIMNDTIFIAAADCTGHGVPGALVSVVCSNALNRTVKEFNLTDPGSILDKTRELVLETFEKSSSDVKDGMDISLLSLDIKNKKIAWAGANNPLWYIQNAELKEIKANKQPIGRSDHPQKFKTHHIEYKENTTFYLFTDGLADQFGGPKEKKFKRQQFSKLLVHNNQLPSQETLSLIDKTFENWKGNLEQVDDVCVIGIRV